MLQQLAYVGFHDSVTHVPGEPLAAFVEQQRGARLYALRASEVQIFGKRRMRRTASQRALDLADRKPL